MTTINATINGQPFGSAAKRIEVFHEIGGIGTFELYLDNSSGASQILDTNYVASNIGINGTNLMQGTVDDVLPIIKDVSAVWSKYVTVKGRNYGRDLASLFYSKIYKNIRFDDLVEDGLAIVGSEITFTSAHEADHVDAEFNKTYLQEGFAEAASKLGYGFNVKNDKSFEYWDLSNPPSSGVLLKAVAEDTDNNILKIDPESKLGVDLRNYVMVSGGKVKNGVWTSGNASDWTGENCAAVNESGLTVSGLGSIKGDVTAAGQSKLYLPFPKYNYATIDFRNTPSTPLTLWIYTNFSNFIWPFTDANVVNLYLKDTDGNEIICAFRVPPQKWTKLTVEVGTNTIFDPQANLGKWFVETGTTFNWNIVAIGVYLYTPADGDFYVDGLELDVDFFAIAEDATSQAAYDLRMIPLNRTDVKSQVQLQLIANAELAARKGISKKLKLTCAYQPSLLYAGYLVDVLAPTAYIGYESTPAKYIIVSVRHTAEPGADLCKGHDAISELELAYFDEIGIIDATRMKLATSSQTAINVRYDKRIDVLEKSLTGAGSFAGGGGGGAGFDLSNIPYIYVRGDSYLYGLIDSKQEFYIPASWSAWMAYLENDFASLPETVSKYRASDITEGMGNYATDLIAGLWRQENGFSETAPFWLTSHHLVVKKDFFAKGQVLSMEGCLTLFGGYAGWITGAGGYNTNNPIVILARAADGYNELELRTPDHGYGGLKCGLVDFRDSNVRIYRPTSGDAANQNSVRVQTPADGGLIVEQALAVGKQLTISVAAGTAPIAPVSTTVCTNLNADLLDGVHSSSFAASSHSHGAGDLPGTFSSLTINYLTCGDFESSGQAQITPTNTSSRPVYMTAGSAGEIGTIGTNQSTLRVKKNIDSVTDTSWVYDLRPVFFDWKDEKRAKLEGRQMGLIAEEVHALCPKLVWLDRDGFPEGVHYEWLAVPMINELKKLRSEVEDLREHLGLKPTIEKKRVGFRAWLSSKLFGEVSEKDE